MFTKFNPSALSKNIAALLVAVLVLLTATSTALAFEGALNTYQTATIDGDPSEWDTDVNGLDFYAYMYRAGKADKDITGYLYLRYDCDSSIMYVYVNSPDFKIDTSVDDESFVKIDGNKKVDASYSDFAYVGHDTTNDLADGWEASFALSPGTYSIQVHSNFIDPNESGSQTSGTIGQNDGIPITASCPCTGAGIRAIVCEDDNGNGVCDDNEPRFPSLSIPMELVPDSPTMANPILIGGTAGTGQVVFESNRDGYTVPGDYSVQIQDAYLLAQGFYPTTASSYSFTIGACGYIEREFAYTESALGTIGDLVWYDADDDTRQDEWYDHNDNNQVDEYVLGLPIPIGEYEWIDVNGNGRYGTVDANGNLNDEGEEGELNRCGIPGVEVVMTNPSLTADTNLLGYYRFFELPLDNSYSTTIDENNAALVAGANYWFDINNDGVTGTCASDIPSSTAVIAASFVSSPVRASSATAASCGLTTDDGRDSSTLNTANDTDLTLDYAIVCTDGPLAVTLSDFAAARNGSIVEIVWETATESGVAGFNIHVDGENGLIQVNETLIPSSVIDSVTPTAYSYETEIGSDLFYLELVNIDGSTETFGPFSITTFTQPIAWLPFVTQ